MPRAPSDYPPIATGTEAAMLVNTQHDTRVAEFIRRWEPNTIDHQAAFHQQLRELLHAYVDAADRLAAGNLRQKIREEHAAGLDG